MCCQSGFVGSFLTKWNAHFHLSLFYSIYSLSIRRRIGCTWTDELKNKDQWKSSHKWGERRKTDDSSKGLSSDGFNFALDNIFFVLIYEYHNKMSNSFCLSLFLSSFHSVFLSFIRSSFFHSFFLFAFLCLLLSSFSLFFKFLHGFPISFLYIFLFFTLFFPTVHFLVIFFIGLTFDSSLA